VVKADATDTPKILYIPCLGKSWSLAGGITMASGGDLRADRGIIITT
jgi:hypothetical protein